MCLCRMNEWERVYTGTTGAKEGYTFLIDLEGMQIQDVRVTFTSYSTDAGSPYPGVAEIEVYAQTDDAALRSAADTAEQVILQKWEGRAFRSDWWVAGMDA